MKKLVIPWVIIAIMLTVSLLFIGYNVQKHDKDYRTLENDLIEASDIYLKNENIDLKINEKKVIKMETLIEKNILNSELKDKLSCDGYVEVKKGINKIDFKPYIKCDDYETIE